MSSDNIAKNKYDKLVAGLRKEIERYFFSFI